MRSVQPTGDGSSSCTLGRVCHQEETYRSPPARHAAALLPTPCESTPHGRRCRPRTRRSGRSNVRGGRSSTPYLPRLARNPTKPPAAPKTPTAKSFKPGLCRTHRSSPPWQNNVLSPTAAATVPTVAPAMTPTSTGCLETQLRDGGAGLVGCASSKPEPGSRLGSKRTLLTRISIGSPSPLNLDGCVARPTMSENPCGDCPRQF